MPDREERDSNRGIHYYSNGNSRLLSWALGIASALITAAVMFGAAALYDMNAQLAVINFRLAMIERQLPEDKTRYVP